MLLTIIVAVLIISLISLVGIFTLKSNIEKYLTQIVAFAAGVLLGAAFIDIIPEAAHELGETGYLYILGGIVLFFLMERFIFWHHCHTHNHDIEPYTYLNLIGDGVHNLVDGALIAAAFLTDWHIGVITTVAVALHEIPQEIGDFGILVHGGFSPNKALFFNFLTALTALVGAVVTYFVATSIEGILPVLLAIAGGGFVYIATSDLIPELDKGKGNFKQVLGQTILFLLGIAIMYWMSGIIPHGH